MSTPVALGSAGANAQAAGTLSLTTSSSVPAGQAIIAFSGRNLGTGAISFSDQVSNSYTAGSQFGFATVEISAHYKLNATALPSSDTITATYASGTANDSVIAIKSDSVPSTGFDNAGPAAGGTGTAVSVTEGTTTNVNRLILAYTYIAGGAADSFTEATGWGTLSSQSDNGDILRIAFKFVSSLTAQTYNPTLGTSRVWATNTISFKTLQSETGTGTMAFAGASFAAAGHDWETGTAGLNFTKASFAAAGHRVETGTAGLNFTKASFSAAGADSRVGTAVLNFTKASFSAAGADSRVGTAALNFAGASFTATGHDWEFGTGALHFTKASFTAAGHDWEFGTGALHFAGASFSGSGTKTTPTTPHRYWRLSLVAQAASAFSFQALEFRTTPGGANVATGGTATASNTYSGLSITNCFAGTGLWGSTNAALPAWVKYDFGVGNDKSIVEVAALSRNDSNYPQTASDFVVEHSDDDITYTTAWYCTHTWTQNQQTIFTVPTAAPGGSHAWWGVACLTDSAGAFSMAELQHRATIGGSSQNTGGTARATFSFSGVPASQAFDGNTATLWGSNDNSAPCLLTYAFTGAVSCAEVAMIARNDSFFGQTPATFEVIYSDNGKTWLSAWAQTAATWSAGATQTFTNSGAINETGTALLSFPGATFSAAGGDHTDGGTATLHFGGISISAVGSDHTDTATAAMHFGGIAIYASGFKPGPAGTGLRQFWTF